MSDADFKTVPNAGAAEDAKPAGPRAPEADLAAAVTHLLAGHEQLIGLIEHLSSVIPAAGIGAAIGSLRARLEAAKTALFATPPPG